MSRRRGPPGRETAAATSAERRIWYGYGTLSRAEKSGVGVFLHDTTRVFAEVSVFSLPVLLAIMEYPATGWYDAKATGLVAWLAMTLAGTLVRGGWVAPLATTTPGWVTLAPWLLALRVVLFNAAMAVAAFGGLAVGETLGWPPASVVWAAAVAALAALSFPRLAEEWLALVG